MKQLFKLGKLYVPALVLVCSMGLTSCSDDDDNAPVTTVYSQLLRAKKVKKLLWEQIYWLK